MCGKVVRNCPFIHECSWHARVELTVMPFSLTQTAVREGMNVLCGRGYLSRNTRLQSIMQLVVFYRQLVIFMNSQRRLAPF